MVQVSATEKNGKKSFFHRGIKINQKYLYKSNITGYGRVDS